jgi:hypothetical protein
MACSLLRTPESIATPCYLKTLTFLENFKDVTLCDILAGQGGHKISWKSQSIAFYCLI